MRRSSLVAAAAVLAAATLQARGDELYTITTPYMSPGALYAGTYTVLEPTFLTQYTVIPAADLTTSSGSPLFDLEIDPDGDSCFGVIQEPSRFPSCTATEFAGPNGQIASVYNALYNAPLTSDATYLPSPNFGAQSLNISYVTPTTPTPEPFGIVLLGTGLLALATVLRKHTA